MNRINIYATPAKSLGGYNLYSRRFKRGPHRSMEGGFVAIRNGSFRWFDGVIHSKFNPEPTVKWL